MGSIISVHCPKCNFKRKVYFGGGYLDFENLCKVPAIDKKTGKFGVRNILNKKNKRNFNFYSEPELTKSNERADDSLFWGGFQLKKIKNLCPECKQYTLEFHSIGNWD